MNTNDLLNDLFGKLADHARLVGKGIDNRTALELTFGKDASDEAHQTIAEINNEKFEPNEKNN